METLIAETPEVRVPKTSSDQTSLSLLLIGVGERHRHDRQVGLYVARRIREECGDAISVVEETEKVLDLMEEWQQSDTVFVVDAVVDGQGPGTIHRFEICSGRGCDEEIPSNILFSIQSTGLAEIVHLAEYLGKLPAKLIIYGIEAEHFEPGDGLTLPALAAAEQVVREIVAYVRSVRNIGLDALAV